MNKSLTISTLFMLLALLLSACQGVEPAPAAEPAEASAAESTEVVEKEPAESEAADEEDADAAEGVLVLIPAEISGEGELPGTHWANGVMMAIGEINAAGGILDQQVTYEVLDTQTDPDTSQAVIAAGLEQNPVAVLGPVYSSSTLVNMIEAQQAGVPQIVGAEVPDITLQGNEFIFRTSSGQSGALPKIANYLVEEGVESIAVIYVNNPYGQGGLATAVAAFQEQGIDVLAEVSVEVEQADLAAEVMQALESGAQAIFSYLTEQESAPLLQELENQGSELPVYGESVLLSQGILDAAGSAANGVRGLIEFSDEVPTIQSFTATFAEKYGEAPEKDALKGYIGAYVYKEMAERVGDFDNAAIAEQLHCALITVEDEPGVLLDIAYDDKGDIDRASFLVEIQDGEQVVIGDLPRLENTCADE